MTKHSLIVVAALALVAGCGKKEETPVVPTAPPPVSQPAPQPVTPPPAPAKTTVAPAQENLAGLLTATKADIEKAYVLAGENKYQEALALLQQRAVAVGNNPEAKQLLDTATTKIKQMMAEAATKKATEEAGNALKNLMK